MLYGEFIKKFKLFTFYRTINSIDFSAHQDTLMLVDISRYHELLKDTWHNPTAHIQLTDGETEALRGGQKIRIFEAENAAEVYAELQTYGKNLIEFYPRLVPDEFIKPEKEEGPFEDLEPVE